MISQIWVSKTSKCAGTFRDGHAVQDNVGDANSYDHEGCAQMWKKRITRNMMHRAHRGIQRVCCGSANGMLAERKLQPKTARRSGSEMEVKGSKQVTIYHRQPA